MKTMNAENLTRNFLQLCYTCDDAHLCMTEEACQACWAEQGLNEMETEGVHETRELLQFYYA
ncbi:MULTISPECIES: hypothetical protein [Paenibacillus]|uniref:Uncharacterized protein n=1 Tax=Paenibacillus vini TaxID=1476024 RepID=A0ABQ4MJ30_9BACL|nr:MULTISPECIES: hypothetical protein [Paenibacillus]MBQ4898150.1 hypothetical protein [Paenibacillus sp. Marseille-P2973]MDN4070366.1 hypothetical protein [Paenibacillus vini]GIP55999.1 hypothetical protein J42TS3_50340 [Paenibacillus vini]